MSIFKGDEFIRVRDLQKINVEQDELLVAKLGVEGMNQEQIEQYVKHVAQTLRDNLPGMKIMITTVSAQNPFDLFAVKAAELVEHENDSK
jgi:hypothetical protein